MFKKLRLFGIAVILGSLTFSTAFVSLPNKNPKPPLKWIEANKIYKDIVWMSNRDNARVAGTEGERKTADQIIKRFKSYGLEVKEQKFPFLQFINHGGTLTINQPEQKQVTTSPLTYSPRTPEQGITAELVWAKLGKESDFAGLDVKGKIALIQRGELNFYEKTQNAAKAGAAGVIIYNNTTGPVNGTLGQPSDVPALGITQADGEHLAQLLSQGQKVNATIHAKTEMKTTTSQNIIGTLKAKKKPNKATTLVIGAHYDGVDTPAANDNASGTATLLEVARVLSKYKAAKDTNITFIAFGAEENGLLGSKYYVNELKPEEKANIKAMINMDMVGVGDRLGILTGSENSQSFIADLAEEKAKRLQLPYERSFSTRSDHAPFEEAGIPVVFFHYMDDPNYHTDQDTIDKIQKEDLQNAGVIVSDVALEITHSKKLPKPKAKDKKVK
jgi:aminopeptidase YwaD